MILTQRLFIRPPEPTDAKLLHQFEETNKEYFRQWQTTGDSIHSPEEWQHRITNWMQEYNQDKAVRFLLFLKENQKQLVGICNFTHIIRNPLQACYLGYKIDFESSSKGLMTEALEATIAHMFHHHNLHRIMANYQPSNTASAKLLRGLGFKVEGYAYDYLLTENGWQDQILTSRINHDWNYTQEQS